MRPLILVPTIISRHWNACYLQLLSVQRCQHPGSRPARSDDRRALGRRHPAGAASPHTEASWANALGQCFRGDYLICYSPQEGGVVWEAKGRKGGFWLPTFERFCDGSKAGRIERERREGPRGPWARRQSVSLLPFCLSVLWPLLSSVGVGVLSHPERCALASRPCRSPKALGVVLSSASLLRRRVPGPRV